MTAPKPLTLLAEAQAERSRLADAARAVDAVVDKLAAEALERRAAKHAEWSRAILDDRIATDARLRAAEQAAARDFRVAAVSGDPRAPWLAWEAAADRLNLQHTRLVTARANQGQEQSETFSPSRDRPTYSAALDLVMAEAAADRLAEGQTALQLELNALDEIDS